ncbi:MAG: MarR family transcriptional regulator [Rhizobiales bacterium]|nr:MarR family transcriptional regulator [Hyphomicrobiales bacterium]OJY44862.1 MAG: MarR family transcriptional regulator [Rhizobiales bacterium 64-17]
MPDTDAPTPAFPPADRIDAVRAFNRFYTQRIGVLEAHYQASPFSLTEARALYEIIHRDHPAAGEIARDLGLDNGYLSRILSRFEKDGLIRREVSKTDGRQTLLSATARGRRQYETLEAATRRGIGEMLAALPDSAQQDVAAAMDTIRRALSDDTPAVPFILRAPAPGDFGWIVARHGEIYGRDYGWLGPFEGLCARIAADFVEKHDPRRERCWIAERDGARAGSIFLMKDSDETARIRLLLVEPWARGHGIGERLTQECIAFARAAGYRHVTLWTHSILTSARRIYQRAGFTLTATKPHSDWGPEIVGETWDLKL